MHWNHPSLLNQAKEDQENNRIIMNPTVTAVLLQHDETLQQAYFCTIRGRVVATHEIRCYQRRSECASKSQRPSGLSGFQSTKEVQDSAQVLVATGEPNLRARKPLMASSEGKPPMAQEIQTIQTKKKLNPSDGMEDKAASHCRK